MIIKLSFFFVISFFANLAFSAVTTPIPVKIHFFEALSPKDTTSSTRFQKEFEDAVAIGKKLMTEELASCGYQVEEQIHFFSSTDSVEALEKAKQSSKEDVWMLVGPRRSNHYVLLAQGAPEIPSVSTMASSEEVEKMGRLHLSIAPFNRQMAKVAAKEAKNRSAVKHPTYVSIVSEDCITCLDFDSHFNSSANSLGMKRLKEFKISGETPELGDIVKNVSTLKPSFILIPNYSKVVVQVIAALHKVTPKSFFVGGDGWGDASFGFLQDAKSLEGTKGITVRGFPTVGEGLSRFKMGLAILSSKNPEIKKPQGGPTLAVLKILDTTTNLLCRYRPKNKEQFTKIFKAHGGKAFGPPWGVSIYSLNNGDITFEKTVELK